MLQRQRPGSAPLTIRNPGLRALARCRRRAWATAGQTTACRLSSAVAFAPQSARGRSLLSDSPRKAPYHSRCVVVPLGKASMSSTMISGNCTASAAARAGPARAKSSGSLMRPRAPPQLRGDAGRTGHR